MIRDRSCVWRNTPQLGQNNITLLLPAVLLNSNQSIVEPQAYSGQSTCQETICGKNRQGIHWKKSATDNATDKHVTVGECCFEVDSAERWLDGYQDPTLIQ